MRQSRRCKWALRRWEHPETIEYIHDQDEDFNHPSDENTIPDLNDPMETETGPISEVSFEETPTTHRDDAMELQMADDPMPMDDATPTRSTSNANPQATSSATGGPTSKRKADVQLEAEQPAAVVEKFPSAGKVLRQHMSVFEAWKANQSGENLYYPFKNKLDYEVGKWAKQHGPGNKALDKLLAFPAVSRAFKMLARSAL